MPVEVVKYSTGSTIRERAEQLLAQIKHSLTATPKGEVVLALTCSLQENVRIITPTAFGVPQLKEVNDDRKVFAKLRRLLADEGIAKRVRVHGLPVRMVYAGWYTRHCLYGPEPTFRRSFYSGALDRLQAMIPAQPVLAVESDLIRGADPAEQAARRDYRQQLLSAVADDSLDASSTVAEAGSPVSIDLR